jgi:FecR protein
MTQRRPARTVCGVATLLTWILAGAPAEAAPAATRDYVVKPGDTCLAIAERELGDRAGYRKLHELNPGLGALPHNLVPGTILKLPAASGTAPPDARLSRAQGVVRFRKPELEHWDAAAAGLDLFRAWRIRSNARSSADVVFRDNSLLAMRENTIVVIFGATAPSAASRHTEAVLETGGLESKLTAASRTHLVVRTPSSEARLAAGRSLVTVDSRGTSIVANHAGTPVAVRGVDARRRPTGASVAVTAGMGSKVEPQQPPSPPRKLPPPPAWPAGPDRFIDLGAAGATVAMRWTPVTAAAHYRVEILAAGGGELVSAEVPARVTSFEAHRLPPGDYVARVSTIDADRFESVRSPDRAFRVVTAQVFAPGASQPLTPPPPPAAASTAAEAPDLTLPTPALRLARGSRVVAPDGMTCGLAAEPGRPELTLTGVGEVAITCTPSRAPAGAATPPPSIPASVVPIRLGAVPAGPSRAIAAGTATHVIVTVASDGALGTGLTVHASEELRIVSATPGDGVIDVVVEPTGSGGDRGRLIVAAGAAELGSVELALVPRPGLDAATRPGAAPIGATRPARLQLGGYTGYQLYRTDPRAGAELGRATDPAAAIGPGPAVGARLVVSLLPGLALDTELGLVIGTWAATPGRSVILTWRSHASLALGDLGSASLHLIAGAGTDSLLRTIPGTRRDTAIVLDRGLRVSFRDSTRRVTWWLELRDDLTPSRDGSSSDVLSLRAGFLR